MLSGIHHCVQSSHGLIPLKGVAVMRFLGDCISRDFVCLQAGRATLVPDLFINDYSMLKRRGGVAYFDGVTD